jgi:hypothetical protein
VLQCDLSKKRGSQAEGDSRLYLRLDGVGIYYSSAVNGAYHAMNADLSAILAVNIDLERHPILRIGFRVHDNFTLNVLRSL